MKSWEIPALSKNFQKFYIESGKSFAEEISWDKQGGKRIIELGSNHFTGAIRGSFSLHTKFSSQKRW